MKNDIKIKLAKILALAERGEGGENTNAREILNKMLSKHGLSLDDIVAKEKDENVVRAYEYKQNYEKTILFHCCAKVMNVNSIKWRRRWGKRAIEFMMGELDHVELSEMYKYYKNLFQEEIEVAIRAFVYKHDLFSNHDAGEGEGEKLGEERLVRIISMMANMKKAKYISTRKRLA